MKDKIIIALDTTGVVLSKRVVAELGDVISFYKVGVNFDLKNQIGFVQYLINLKKRVFLDFKYYGIPSTIERAVEQVEDLGVTFVSVYGSPQIVEASVKARRSANLKIIAVPYLSSEIIQIKPIVKKVKELVSAGCDGIIASGKAVEQIRNEIDKDILIITTGIRQDVSIVDDHVNYLSPLEAFKFGADYIVVGRPVIGALYPRRAAEKILKDAEEGGEGD